MACPPIIYIFFNRPEVTRRTFGIIRAQRPRRLYLVADGPRPGREEDAVRCNEARRIVENMIDWDCEVTRDYSATNLGCGRRVSTGLTAAFNLLGEAIVLEDDCLPHPSFFGYCGWLLEFYRNDKEVMHINGTNLAQVPLPNNAAYRFSHQVWIWGWASWQRAWSHYDYPMQEWPNQRASAAASFASTWEAQYWNSTYDRTHRDVAKADTWDFQWAAACRSRGGLTLLPARNLVSNLGFGAEATHTTSGLNHLDLESHPAAPEIHSAKRRVDPYLDELFTRRYANTGQGARDNLISRLRVWKYSLRKKRAGRLA